MAERPEDLNLPNAIIGRIVKDNLPKGVAVSKEARSAIARAASVFVLYATSTSLSITHKNKKKTLMASDVLAALGEMEFQEFIGPLEESLAKYRKVHQSKKDAKNRAKKTEDKEKTNVNESVTETEPMEVTIDDDDEVDKEN